MDVAVSIRRRMIRQRRPMMTYTWFNRAPRMALLTTHLFSPVDKRLPGMMRVPFPTMVVDLREEEFVRQWSESARTKVNRASREPIEIRRGGELLPDILQLFRPTAYLRGLRGYAETHFDSIPHVECTIAYYEGAMLCGHIWVVDDDERRAVLYVNASSHHRGPEDSSLYGRAHYYLLWQDGLYLRHIGVETMDLMGYDPETTNAWLKGVYQWKAATHGSREMLYHYYPAWFHQVRRIREALGR